MADTAIRSARRVTSNQFDIWEQRTALTRKLAADESAEIDARTAKLRALRLEKEKADKLAAADAPAAPAARPRVRRVNVT